MENEEVVEKQEEKTKKVNKGTPVIVILLILALLCAGGYIAYLEFFDNKEDVKSEEKSENSKKSGNDKEETSKKLEINEGVVKSLYSYYFNGNTTDVAEYNMAFINEQYKYKVYSDKKVVIDEAFNYGEKMGIAFGKMYADEVSVSSMDAKGQTITFETKDIVNSYKRYFGQDKNVETKKFDAPYSVSCKIDDKIYVCSRGYMGGVGGPTEFLVTFDEYQTDSDALYIIEATSYYDSSSKKFYKDSNFKNEINGLSGDKDILKSDKAKEKVQHYKHTFKQNSDGTFYWYSSEPIK